MKAWKVAVAIVITLIVISIMWGVVFSMSGVMKNEKLISVTENDVIRLISGNEELILTLSDSISYNNELINGNVESISDNTTLIEINAKSAFDNAELIEINAKSAFDNAKLISDNSILISDNTDATDELSRIVWAHGAKINRVVDLMFQVAFEDSTVSEKILNYTRDPYANKGIWDEALLGLNKKELEKIVKIAKIEEQTLLTKEKITKIKKGCFKR